MKKNIFLLIAVTVMIGCEPQEYSEEHKYANTYLYFDRNDLETVLILIPNGKDKVYTDTGEINTEAFETIENDLIWFEDNILFVNMLADYLYYDGDKTSEQDWRKEGETSYLKLLNPVPGKHLLSISKKNY